LPIGQVDEGGIRHLANGSQSGLRYTVYGLSPRARLLGAGSGAFLAWQCGERLGQGCPEKNGGVL